MERPIHLLDHELDLVRRVLQAAATTIRAEYVSTKDVMIRVAHDWTADQIAIVLNKLSDTPSERLSASEEVERLGLDKPREPSLAELLAQVPPRPEEIDQGLPEPEPDPLVCSEDLDQVLPVTAAAHPVAELKVPRPGEITDGLPPAGLYQKTPERVALLRKLCLQKPRPSNREMHLALNRLPGSPIHYDRISAYVTQWGCQRATPEEQEAARAREAGGNTNSSKTVGSAVGEGFGQMVVNLAYAIQWGTERGIPGPKLDLARVNAKRRDLQLPQFVVEA